eukprot:1525862-Prymnesium_polylepis.1
MQLDDHAVRLLGRGALRGRRVPTRGDERRHWRGRRAWERRPLVLEGCGDSGLQLRQVLEGELVGEQLEQHHRERPDVGPARVALVADHLGRHPTVRARLRRERASLGAVGGVGGKPKVGETGRAARVEQHVGPFQVAVYDPPRVQVHHARRDALRHTQRKAWRRVSLQRGCEVGAVAVLEHQRIGGWLDDGAHVAHDVWVAESREHFDLGRPAAVVSRHLDGNRVALPARQVCAARDRTHATQHREAEHTHATGKWSNTRNARARRERRML